MFSKLGSNELKKLKLTPSQQQQAMHGWVIVANEPTFLLCPHVCVHVEVSLERHASNSNQVVAKINTFLIYKQKASQQAKLAYFSIRLLESSQTARNQSVCSL